MMRLFARVMLAMCLAVAAGSHAQAQTRPKITSLGPDYPKATLFVGNSFFYYNNGMPGHLSYMQRAADAANKAAYRNTMATIGGSGLDWHDMDNLLRPGGLGAYSFDDQNVVVFNKPGKQFDTVVMMDCSQCPIHPQLKDAFSTFARKDSEIVRAHGMRPVLFMSWAYLDKPEMTEGLAEAIRPPAMPMMRWSFPRASPSHASASFSRSSTFMRRTSGTRVRRVPTSHPA